METELEEDYNKCPTDDFTAAVTDKSSALAVVPYDANKILNFHHEKRSFVVGQHKIIITQKWDKVGVAAVVWDAVCMKFIFYTTGNYTNGNMYNNALFFVKSYDFLLCLSVCLFVFLFFFVCLFVCQSIARL